ncbi:MAG: hypothetical protein NDJ90_06840 [Oligoflexia bacterium]|nr:hypothetical protein [Oligoflexia bacterium]
MGSDRPRRPVFAPLLVAGLALLATSCVSARFSGREPDRLFQEGRYDDSAVLLRKAYEEHGGESGRDSLLYLLDLGLALHSAGKYEESNQVLLQADRLAEIKDYTSLATEGATLLTGENLKDYKAEDFENVLINTYLAMNYALIGDAENALVEARRVNRKLHLMVTEGQRGYKQNAFARYLSAILYEAEGEYNDAYIDYQETRKLEPGLPGLGLDLWRMARFLRMRDEQERWNEEYGLTGEDHERAKLLAPGAGKGEIIVLYENGLSPEKRPNPQFTQLPRFYARANPVSRAEVEIDGQASGATFLLHDIEATAIQNLEEKYGKLIAKRLAGVVTKELVSDEIGRRTNSPLLGFLVKAAFYASDQADVRSWNLLPRDLQLSRHVVEPGVHEVRLSPSGSGTSQSKTVEVRAGRKVFVNFRYMP